MSAMFVTVYSPEASVAWNEQEANQELVQGRAAMFIGWWWMASRMTNSEIPKWRITRPSPLRPAGKAAKPHLTATCGRSAFSINPTTAMPRWNT